MFFNKGLEESIRVEYGGRAIRTRVEYGLWELTVGFIRLKLNLFFWFCRGFELGLPITP